MSQNLTQMEHFNSSAFKFGATGATKDGDGIEYMNIPKARFSFIVHFEITDTAKKFIRTLYGTDLAIGALTSYMVKDVDRPSFSFETTETNQYNRTRLVQGKVKYDPLSMVIYDTVSSAGLTLIDAYRSYYYGDFSDKSLKSWAYDTVSTTKTYTYDYPLTNVFKNILTATTQANDNYTWGRSIFNQGDKDEGYFFKRIDIYEIDGNTYTVHNIHNPVIESVKLDNKTSEGGDAATITINFKYEGITNICPVTSNKAISASTADIASRIVASGHGEWSQENFFKYWGELDDAPLSAYDFNQVKGFPGTNGGLDFSNTASSINSVISIANTADNVMSAIENGGSLTDMISNTKNALYEGNIIKSSGLSYTAGTSASTSSSLFSKIKSIGGLF